MKWYENLSNAQILELKDNIRPLMFCPEWMQEAFKFGVQCDGEYLDHVGKWNRVVAFAPFDSDGIVLRLRQDWQRSETKWSAILEDAKKKVYQQGHWEECEIRTRAKPDRGYIDFGSPCFDTYWFSRQRIGRSPHDPIQRLIDYDLHEAFSMVGFGGIYFEGSLPSLWNKAFPDQYGDEKPQRPLTVRFWVE